MPWRVDEGSGSVSLAYHMWGAVQFLWIRVTLIPVWW